MFRFILSILISLIAAFAAIGQQALLDSDRTLYSKEIAGGVVIHNEGWGLQFVHGIYKTSKKRSLLQAEIVGLKHPKEIKSFNPFFEDSRGYFFGKLNSVLLFRPSFGQKVQITDKIRKSGVEVNYIWNVGPSLALIKPVYLQIGFRFNDNGDPERGFPFDFIADERYDPDLHFVDNIFGRSSFFKGLGELSVEPGLFGRFGFNFEYDSENAGLRALEVGVSVDAYANRIPILAFDPDPPIAGDPSLTDNINKRVFIGFYFAAQLGKKYTR